MIQDGLMKATEAGCHCRVWLPSPCLSEAEQSVAVAMPAGDLQPPRNSGITLFFFFVPWADGGHSLLHSPGPKILGSRAVIDDSAPPIRLLASSFSMSLGEKLGQLFPLTDLLGFPRLSPGPLALVSSCFSPCALYTL